MLTIRPGYVLIEGLVVLTLSLLIAALLCASLSAQSRIARVLGNRIAYDDAARATLHILDAELRMADPASDLRQVGADSVAGRWTRATGSVCARQGTTVWVRLRGIRAPDDTKDSVLVIGPGGEGADVLRGITRDSTRCSAAPDEQVYRWTAAPAQAAAGGVIIVFESGSYYLSQRAFRYRLGAEGRQPITEEFFRDADSSFRLVNADTGTCARLQISLALRPAMSQTSGRAAHSSVTFPNARPCT
jgi:hypothetical protein